MSRFAYARAFRTPTTAFAALCVYVGVEIATGFAFPSVTYANPQSGSARDRAAAKSRRERSTRPATSSRGGSTARAGSSAQAAPSFRGPTRIDFDDRLIQGQTNKSGAVYLFDRKETGISSMVRRRKSFRHLTIATIYDR